MGVDQSNESVVVGDRAVVKLFPRTHPGPQPGVDLPAHLSAVGFGEIPSPLGAIRWRGDTLVASVAAFVVGARDGWQWCVDDVVDACERDDWTAADAHPAALGGLVARLHRALGTPSPVIPTPVHEAGPDTIATWRADADARLAEAVALTSGSAGERLRALEPVARAAIASLAPVERTTVMRIHGDLHVGQVLRGRDGSLSVNDFDGNPLASDRMAPDAPARDVASMTCAIDHVGRVVARRHPEHAGVRVGLGDPISRGLPRRVPERASATGASSSTSVCWRRSRSRRRRTSSSTPRGTCRGGSTCPMGRCPPFSSAGRLDDLAVACPS